MTNTDKTDSNAGGMKTRAGGDETKPDGTGDVEQSGETTAAATIGGDMSADKPVGAETLVRVEGDPDPSVEAG